MPSSRDLLDPGMEPASLTSPALAGRVSPLAPPGKPGLLPCREILYQLSYKGGSLETNIRTIKRILRKNVSLR